MVSFRYNASALGAGAVIERDGRTTQIPSLASVALAPTGGEGYGIETDYSSEPLSFSCAETRVQGFQESKDVFTTRTEVRVTDLSVYGELKVALMEASMISTRNIKDRYSEFQVKARYEGISVNGREIVAEEDVEIQSCLTYAHFQRLLEVIKRKLYKGDVNGLLARFGAKTLDDLLGVVRKKQAVQGSIVRKLGHRDDLQSEHHMVPVPGVGKAYFGEMVLKPEHRLVSLLRIEFNPNAHERPANESVQARRAVRARSAESGEDRRVRGGGSMTIASVEGNGSPILP
jgi:hypothetical protein